MARLVKAGSGPKWEYTDNTGVKREGTVERVLDRGGSDITYFFRRDDGTLDVLSGTYVARTKAGPIY